MKNYGSKLIPVELTYLYFRSEIELELSFSLAKVDLNAIFDAAHWDCRVELLEAQHAIRKPHLVDFTAVESKENFLCPENIAYTNRRAFLLEINVQKRS